MSKSSTTLLGPNPTSIYREHSFQIPKKEAFLTTKEFLLNKLRSMAKKKLYKTKRLSRAGQVYPLGWVDIQQFGYPVMNDDDDKLWSRGTFKRLNIAPELFHVPSIRIKFKTLSPLVCEAAKTWTINLVWWTEKSRSWDTSKYESQKQITLCCA